MSYFSKNNAVLTNNSTTAALNNAATFTGTADNVSFWDSIVIAIKTDQSGVLYADFSPDGTNWDSTLTYTITAGVNEVHRLTVTRAYFRIRIYNNSGSNQTYLRAQSIAGQFAALTSVLSSSVQVDADTTLVRPTDYTIDVTSSKYQGQESFHKFGRNSSVGTSIVPITSSGAYQTPTSLTNLEIISSSANDTSGGSGGRTVVIIGIGTDWAEISETVTLNGTTAVALANQYYRVYRMYVSESGTYASSSAGSHAGTITLRSSGGGSTWATIDLIDGLGRGQTQISAYTVPAGKTLYITSFDCSIDATKNVNLVLFQRTNADVTSAPYYSMRVVREYTGFQGYGHVELKFPLVFNEKTDVGFMAETTSSTAAVSVQFDGVLIDN